MTIGSSAARSAGTWTKTPAARRLPAAPRTSWHVRRSSECALEESPGIRAPRLQDRKRQRRVRVVDPDRYAPASSCARRRLQRFKIDAPETAGFFAAAAGREESVQKRARCARGEGNVLKASSRSYSARSRSATAVAPLGNRAASFPQAIVSFAFDAMREFGVAGLHDASVDHDVHDVGNDVLQNARIVRDDQKAGVCALRRSRAAPRSSRRRL